MYINAITTGIRLASGAVSTSAALPEGSAPAAMRNLRISATAPAHVRLGFGPQTAVNTDLMVQPGEPLLLWAPASTTHVAVIRAAVDGIVQISALG